MPDARQTSEVSVTPVITANLCCGLNSSTFNIMGFPGGSDGKESACNMGDLGLYLGWEDLLEKGKTTHFSILA